MCRKKSPGCWIPEVTHLRPSHTHTRSHLLEPRRAARSVLPPAGIFFFLSLAKWSLCPHENLWHFIPAEKWAGRRFDHKSASSHSSQSAAALGGTDLVLFSLAWGKAGAIGEDLERLLAVCVALSPWTEKLRGSPVLSMGAEACRLFKKHNLSVTRLEQQGEPRLCKQEMECN